MFVPFAATEPPIKIFCGPADPAAAHVSAFCKRINSTAAPVFLSISPEPGCLPRECFPNVLHQVEKASGRIQYGWAIWEWPRVFIEAEHHAVYEAPDGSWHDLTPSIPEDPQSSRLFLPDDTAVFDVDSPNGTNRDNIRQALSQDARIDEYLQLAADLAAILMRAPGSGMVTFSGPDAARIQAIVKRNSQLKREIAHDYTPQGAPCYCGSGQKFKRCHGELRKARR